MTAGMDVSALHLEIRNALVLADELARHAHILDSDTLSGYLAAVRTSLGELERAVGRSHEHQPPTAKDEVARLERSVHVLRERFEEIPTVLRPRLVLLMAALERIVFAELRPASPVPAKTLLGSLPLARVVPQGVHSVFDYVAAAAYLTSAALATRPRARIVGVLLGARTAAVSLLTDYRLATNRKLPIETHEAIDYAVGIGAIVTPLALGYRRKDRLAAGIQIAVGVTTVLVSLFTDYRADRGVGYSLRSGIGRRLRSLRPRARKRESYRFDRGLEVA